MWLKCLTVFEKIGNALFQKFRTVLGTGSLNRNNFCLTRQRSAACQTYGHFLLVLSFVSLSFFHSSCSYKTPATETPAPNNQGIEKSFFQETVHNNKTGAVEYKPKTFLCGWAPVTEIGSMAEGYLTHNAPAIDHCNMVFEISERALIGKMINPSFPSDRTKWSSFISIPIEKHYYYEKQKDEKGRDTERFVENDSRSDWSARPYMRLNLNSVQTLGMGSPINGSWSQISIEDIEWDKERNFLAFTSTNVGQAYGQELQYRMRNNFIAFKTNPNFKKTPFNDQNYKYMNVLHLTGHRVNGTDQQMYAAHWDMGKTHEIYLVGFPEEWEVVAEQVVEDWNKQLRDIGALTSDKKGFIVKKGAKLKYAFDLRYSTMTWVSDKRISSYSPLGIAMAHADVQTGEILWGGITLWGGLIEEYIKSYSSSGSGGLGSSALTVLTKFFDKSIFERNLDKTSSLKNEMAMGLARGKSGIESLDIIKDLKNAMKGSAIRISDKQKEQLLRNNDPEIMGLGQIGFQNLINNVKETMGSLLQNETKNISMRELKDLSIGEDKSLTPSLQEKLKAYEGDPKKLRNEILNQAKNKYNSALACTDRTFEQVGLEWKAGLSKSSDLDINKVIRNVVKELISHEYGHFLGLGHQFKENIVPEKGSVPEKYRAPLATNATEEKNFTNFSSVMGYRDPISEINTKEDILPGPQDMLVLRFLYKQQYATFKEGDSDFSYVELPQDGIIPKVDLKKPEYKTSYFPQCNDIDASISIDPYCNRFDRGNKATEIVKNYLEKIDSNIISYAMAFSENRGGNPEHAEQAFWNKSLNYMGRARLFYDYMRMTYSGVIDKLRYDEKSLLQFSKACSDDSAVVAALDNPKLKSIFDADAQLKDLCQANAFTLKRFSEIVALTGSDFNVIDKSSRYTPGGISTGEIDRDYSRIFGRWTELSLIPAKISALYAMVSPTPWAMWGWLIPNPNYDDPSMRYSYAYLYPEEYTKVMAENVKNNLQFANSGKWDRTTIGRSVIAMSWLNELASQNNDKGYFPVKYREMIEKQTQYNFSYVAIILNPMFSEKDGTKVVRFNGSSLDLSTMKSTPLTDVYLLPNGQIIARGEKMFLFPINRLQFFADDSGKQLSYVIAIKSSYEPAQTGDALESLSIRSQMKNLYNDEVNKCVFGSNGHANGLSSYFNAASSIAASDKEKTFTGFEYPSNLATDRESQEKFWKSVEKSFENYYSNGEGASRPDPMVCEESLKGVSMVIGTAALVNGYWFGSLDPLIRR